jgi:hypothetical protein
MANQMRMFVTKTTMSSSSLESITRRDSQETVSNAYFTPPNNEYQDYFQETPFKQNSYPGVAFKTLFDPTEES